MQSFGLKDIPLEKLEDESLGLKEYADSLSEFIQKCETPITIALQGDWGSGKTSLMNLIKESITKSGNIQTIWFNTWQFAQFDMQGDLAISLISHFTDALGNDKNKTTLKTLAGINRWKLLKGLAVGVGSIFGQGDAIREGLKEIEPGKEENYLDPAKQIKALKTNIENMVKDKIENEKTDRIVVFVDDLDRLLPEKAVELLEVFKLFLDVPGCVYVLACDYQVVTQGLKKKFGIGSAELKGRSFFDKIIQLPFINLASK